MHEQRNPEAPINHQAAARIYSTLELLGQRIGPSAAMMCALAGFILFAVRVTTTANTIEVLRAAADRLESADDDGEDVAH